MYIYIYIYDILDIGIMRNVKSRLSSFYQNYLYIFSYEIFYLYKCYKYFALFLQ